MARASTPQQGIQNLRCHEYCDGTEAVFYCPQCSAIFCDSCYSREHAGSVRKQSHERLVEVKPICRVHQHTLEYFDLTSLKAICITCLTNLQSKGEIQNHVIEKLDGVSTKLCSLLSEKVIESKEVLKSVQKATKTTSKTNKRTIEMAKIEVHNFIKCGRRILIETEERINRQINKIQNQFSNSEESTAGLVALGSRLQENIQQAERVSDEASSISEKVPHLFNKLDDLCEMARRRLDNLNRLKLTVSLSKVAAAKILSLVDVEAEMVSSGEISDNAEEEDASRSNFERVVIMCDNVSCSSSTDYDTSSPQTIPDMPDHHSPNKHAGDLEMSPIHSNPLTPHIHGNRTEEPSSPGNHSNDSDELESPDLSYNREDDVDSHSNWSDLTDNEESLDLYDNPQQEDIGSPSNNSIQSDEIERPDLYGKAQEEDIEGPSIQPESPGDHGDLFENVQSRRIHGDDTPENHSNHDNQDEDPDSPVADETDRNRVNERPYIHGNHHVTKGVYKTLRILAQAGSKSNRTRRKRGRKRKRMSDQEWTPTRILRSSTMERRRGGTVPKLRSRRGGELSQEMNRCDAILTILWADEDSWPFVHLVDKKRCPEYYKKISNPVSLENMKQKLHSYQYRSVLDFVRDFNQIIENCHVFNKDDSDVSEAGTRLALRFNNLLRECFPNIENVFEQQKLMDSSL